MKIVRILVRAFISLFAVVTITFFLVRNTPGDPVDLILGDRATEVEKQNLRHELGTDRPLHFQYLNYIERLIHLDFGIGYANRRPVIKDLRNHFGNTVFLGVLSMLLSIVLGIGAAFTLEIIKAKRLLKAVDYSTSVMLSLPTIWIAPILTFLFSVKFDILPVSGDQSWYGIILPAICLSLSLGSTLYKFTRENLEMASRAAFVRTALGKGLSKCRTIFVHVGKNILPKLITILALQMGAVLTGVVITETLFDWPGIGVLLHQGIQSRNYPLIQGCVLLVATIYILTNILSELCLYLLDPRSGR